MDITAGPRVFRMPQELVDEICCHLASTVKDVCSARLVCKAMNRATSPLIVNMGCTPSELFTLPSAKALSPEEMIQHGLYRRGDESRARPVTVWSWLKIASHIAIEDSSTGVGRRFQALMFSPYEAPPEGRSDRCSSTREEGRKSMLWGRIEEQPDTFCIITREVTQSPDIGFCG